MSGAGQGAGADDKPKPMGMAGLFASIKSIDQSSGKTAGLRHVTKDMKKNRPASAGPARKASSAKKAEEKPRKPSKLDVSSTNVVAEHYFKAAAPVELTDAGLTHHVYITNCEQTVFIVPKKIKAMSIENCKKVRVICQDVLASIEVNRCTSCKVNIKSVCPTMSIDQSDGTAVTLSSAGKGMKFVTSKISDTNVTIPKDGDEDEDVQIPIPEQYEHVLDGEKLNTKVSDLYG